MRTQHTKSRAFLRILCRHCLHCAKINAIFSKKFEQKHIVQVHVKLVSKHNREWERESVPGSREWFFVPVAALVALEQDGVNTPRQQSAQTRLQSAQTRLQSAQTRLQSA